MSGYIKGVVRGQEQCRLSDAISFGEVAERYHFDELVRTLGTRLSRALPLPSLAATVKLSVTSA